MKPGVERAYLRGLSGQAPGISSLNLLASIVA